MLRHVWIIGDELLDTSANTLRKLKNEYIFDANKPQLNFFKDFHVEAFHDSEIKPTYKNIIRKVKNNLTIALNKFPQVLPSYVVIMMNNNIIHDPAFVEFELKTILKRVFNDVGRLLTIRKDQIATKHRNVLTDTEVFIMRPLPKPLAALGTDHQRFKNTRRQVNSMLDQLVRTYDINIMNVDSINCAQKVLFQKSGQLSDYGKERMWESISDFITARQKGIIHAIKRAPISVKEAAVQTDFYAQAPRNGNTQEYRDQAQPSSQFATSERADPRHERFDEYHTRYDRNEYRHSREDRDYYY